MSSSRSSEKGRSESYAEIVRKASRTSSDSTGRPLSLRDLARLTGYTYEHCRKVLAGEPVVSPEFNAVLCRVLGLSESEMAGISNREKLQRRARQLGTGQLPPAGTRLHALWPRLNGRAQRAILELAELLATPANRERMFQP